MAFFRRKSESSIKLNKRSEIPNINSSLRDQPQLPPSSSLPRLSQSDQIETGSSEQSEGPKKTEKETVNGPEQHEAVLPDQQDTQDSEQTGAKMDTVAVVDMEASKCLKLDPAEEAYKTPSKAGKVTWHQYCSKLYFTPGKENSDDEASQSQEIPVKSARGRTQKSEAKDTEDGQVEHAAERKREEDHNLTENPFILFAIDCIAVIAAVLLITYYTLHNLTLSVE